MKYEVRDGHVCGIYRITNTVNGKIYVGKSKNVRSRYRQYVRDFEKQAAYHMNRYLLNSMTKYGIGKFKMEILEECPESDLSVREHHWMIELDSLGDNGYNLRSDTDQGMIVHAKTSEKITNRLKEEWSSGVRDDHSEKLKLNWLERDREAQAGVMRKVLTKWMYKVDDGEPISYSQICEMGLKGVLSPFHRKKSDIVTFKGFKIERIKA